MKWAQGDRAQACMTTDSGLTITGDGYGNVLALDTSNGKTLWHAGTGVAHAELANQLRIGWTPIHSHQQRRRTVCVGTA